MPQIDPENVQLLLDLSKVKATFAKIKQELFSPKQLDHLISTNSRLWVRAEPPTDEKLDIKKLEKQGLTALRSGTHRSITKAIVDHNILERNRLPFPYRTETRYTTRELPTYQIIQSIEEHGYFSHYSAIQFHNLTEQIPKAVYFNVEQPASSSGGALSQAGIDRAFRGKCRVSSNVTKFRETTIHKLNGQNTQALGVMSAAMDEGYEIRLTDLERTLIDITVRPIYSGGVSQVARAFKEAAEKVSVQRMVTYLEKMNFTYPYHQSIGFYMEKAQNYKPSDIGQLRQFPIEYDFYLNYQLKNPAHNAKWRLFVPKGF
jgi:hypothetical protein